MKFKPRQSNQQESGKYVKLKDGESVTGIPRGEVYEFKVRWDSGKSQVVPASDPQGKDRYRINFIVHEEGRFVAKILEFGVVVYDDFSDISREMDLSKTKIKVSRKGSTKSDTRYSLIPLGPVAPDMLAKVEAVQLNVLDTQVPVAKPYKGEDDFGDPPPDLDEDLPF